MVLKGSGSKIELEEITACPECDSKHLIRDYNRGEMTCSGCGLVVDDNFIDQGPEWRAFDAEQNEKRSRGGAPMTVMVHDKGLST
ncbi:MAG: transcription initiation factor IIB, partial [Methanobacteriota archaeon]